MCYIILVVFHSEVVQFLASIPCVFAMWEIKNF
nr:MAG TPA: hypothetical protein [Caudoviricetes sp.]